MTSCQRGIILTNDQLSQGNHSGPHVQGQSSVCRSSVGTGTTAALLKESSCRTAVKRVWPPPIQHESSTTGFVKKLHTPVLSICKIASQFSDHTRLPTRTDQTTATCTWLKKWTRKQQYPTNHTDLAKTNHFQHSVKIIYNFNYTLWQGDKPRTWGKCNDPTAPAGCGWVPLQPHHLYKRAPSFQTRH